MSMKSAIINLALCHLQTLLPTKTLSSLKYIRGMWSLRLRFVQAMG